MSFLKSFKKVLFLTMFVLTTSFSNALSAPENMDLTGYPGELNLELLLEDNSEHKEYLLSFQKDLEKKTNIKISTLNNNIIYELYKEAYVQMAEKYEYTILPPIIANKENLKNKVFSLYSFEENDINDIGFKISEKSFFWYSSTDRNITRHVSNSTIKEIFNRNISSNPFEAPVAIVMNDVVNIFGERVGQFQKI